MPDAAGRSNPHDALFRRVLGEPEHAASQLRSVLPPALVAGVELDTLTPVAGSFVDEALRWRHCDLLFRTRCRGRDAFMYVLMEHQSGPDPWMAWRMLRYVTRIWDRYRVEYPRSPALPLIVPVVVYHGRIPWPHPTELSGLLDLDPGWAADPVTAAVLPRFAFLLDDLSGLDETSLRARPLTAPARVTLLLLRRASSPGLAEELVGGVGDLRAVLDRAGGLETFQAMMTYIQLVAEEPTTDLRHIMEQVGPDAEEAYVTIADTLRAEGRAEGRAEALLQLVALRFGPVPDATAAAVHAASTDQIEVWTARVLTAVTLDDVLR